MNEQISSQYDEKNGVRALTQYMLAHGLSDDQIASQTGVSQEQVARLFLRGRKPKDFDTKKVLENIASGLGPSNQGNLTQGNFSTLLRDYGSLKLSGNPEILWKGAEEEQDQHKPNQDSGDSAARIASHQEIDYRLEAIFDDTLTEDLAIISRAMGKDAFDDMIGGRFRRPQVIEINQEGGYLPNQLSRIANHYRLTTESTFGNMVAIHAVADDLLEINPTLKTAETESKRAFRTGELNWSEVPPVYVPPPPVTLEHLKPKAIGNNTEVNTSQIKSHARVPKQNVDPLSKRVEKAGRGPIEKAPVKNKEDRVYKDRLPAEDVPRFRKVLDTYLKHYGGMTKLSQATDIKLNRLKGLLYLNMPPKITDIESLVGPKASNLPVLERAEEIAAKFERGKNRTPPVFKDRLPEADVPRFKKVLNIFLKAYGGKSGLARGTGLKFDRLKQLLEKGVPPKISDVEALVGPDAPDDPVLERAETQAAQIQSGEIVIQSHNLLDAGKLSPDDSARFFAVLKIFMVAYGGNVGLTRATNIKTDRLVSLLHENSPPRIADVEALVGPDAPNDPALARAENTAAKLKKGEIPSQSYNLRDVGVLGPKDATRFLGALKIFITAYGGKREVAKHYGGTLTENRIHKLLTDVALPRESDVASLAGPDAPNDPALALASVEAQAKKFVKDKVVGTPSHPYNEGKLNDQDAARFMTALKIFIKAYGSSINLAKVTTGTLNANRIVKLTSGVSPPRETDVLGMPGAEAGQPYDVVLKNIMAKAEEYEKNNVVGTIDHPSQVGRLSATDSRIFLASLHHFLEWHGSVVALSEQSGLTKARIHGLKNNVVVPRESDVEGLVGPDTSDERTLDRMVAKAAEYRLLNEERKSLLGENNQKPKSSHIR